MNEYKNKSESPGMNHEAGNGNGGSKPGYESTLRDGRVRSLVNPDGNNMGGWDSYRRWLNRVQSSDKRRAVMDPALYTWKGYRNWSEKVRRDWKRDD